MNAGGGARVNACMGQTCNTIVYACTPPDVQSDTTQDRFYDAVHSFKPLCGNRFYGADLVGFELATGGSGHDGAADLDGLTVEITAEALERHEAIGPILRAAREAWPAFAEHIKTATKGKVILTDAPKIYLTETETA